MASQTGGSSRGMKRKANDSLESEQRLSKRFDLLNIENDGKRYIPIHAPIPQAAPQLQPQLLPQSEPQPAKDDYMQVEDTKDKVYIYDLDKELEDIESDADTPVFLSDIEKHISRIPKAVLTSREPVNQNNELVLYSVPSSLTVPEEQDSVRRAIIEARARARAETAQAVGALHTGCSAQENSGMNGSTNSGPVDIQLDNIEDDADAMDIG